MADIDPPRWRRAFQKAENVLIGEGVDPSDAFGMVKQVFKIAEQLFAEEGEEVSHVEFIAQARDRAARFAGEAMLQEFAILERELLYTAAVIARNAADAVEYRGANREFAETAEDTVNLLVKAADKLLCMRGGEFDFRDLLQTETNYAGDDQ